MVVDIESCAELLLKCCYINFNLQAVCKILDVIMLYGFTLDHDKINELLKIVGII